MVSDRRAFGERLKRQRERAGVTLERISQNTKVPVALFAGLESGDCSRWPAGLFARAYVRSYAEAIGLNGDETVEEFVAAFGAVLKSDPFDSAAASSRPAGSLRLSLVDESPFTLAATGRRAGLAACELLIGALIAALPHVGFGTRIEVTVGLVLAYFSLGRLLSDDPLLYALFKRVRQRPEAAAPAENASPDVSAVGDAASTTA